MFHNADILAIAMQQSAIDINCKPDDFCKTDHVIITATPNKNARVYYTEPITCNLVSYGNNIVASVKEDYKPIIEEYIHRFAFYHCFETPNMHWLEERILPLGHSVCFMAEYFLPDTDRLQRLSCNYTLQVLTHDDFSELYKPTWDNALCEGRKELDVLGIGAYDNGKLVGLEQSSLGS